ncbi:hypothetical protein QTH87_22615 [Variovorax sp. J22P168]|uniref:hypothetical protein n=1 Tax=Variovorax jilinensis TaxID=3053513 RepID=UPI002578136B|nr:hypothetical protein [Variovorax sp. J22P168]MDM0015253.1 hypothetical protein [Variovorax sp. J22P168]
MPTAALEVEGGLREDAEAKLSKGGRSVESTPAHEAARRATLIADSIRAGTLVVHGADHAWAKELVSAPRGPTGLVLVWALTAPTARAAAAAYEYVDTQQASTPSASEPPANESFDALAAQTELFHLFGRLFSALTGTAPEYTTFEQIDRRMRELSISDHVTLARAVNKAVDELLAFYKGNDLNLVRAATSFGGMKSVVGGQRQFSAASLSGVRTAGLYVDTQLIADPVHSILTESRDLIAPHVQLAHTLYHLLALEPLVNAGLKTPVVFVFPSFEKSFERHDVVTKVWLAELGLKVLAPACAGTMGSIDDVASYVRGHEEAFLQAAMQKRLFVPLGGDPSATYRWQDAISLHLANLKGHEHPDRWTEMTRMPPAALVLMDTISRIRPVFHLLANAQGRQAQPLLVSPVQWHYFDMCSKALARDLVNEQVLPKHALSTLRALQDDSLGWLSNIPVAGLVELRTNMEHTMFREELKKFTAQLAAADLMSLDAVVRELNHGLKTMVDRQKKAIRDLQDKYAPKTWGAGVGMLGGAAAGAALLFMPTLAAALGQSASVVPLVAAVGAGGLALAKEKTEERVEQRRANRTMLGMLATAYGTRIR